MSAVLIIAVMPPVQAETNQKNVNESLGFVNAYYDDGYVAPEIRQPSYSNLQSDVFAANVPSSYDSRTKGVIPSVKNQGSYGTCWAFSLVSAAEAGLITKKLADIDEIDLSELQMCYYMYNTSEDPLGNYTGDYVSKQSYEGDILQGGNHVYASKALERWNGLVDEDIFDYMKDAAFIQNAKLPNEFASDFDEYRLKNFYSINVKSNPDYVKSNVMKHGALATTYFSDNAYYSSDGGAYYQNVTDKTNHAVCIVGWDDNYSASNFNGAATPSSNGAWLIMNSWGPQMNDNGFFWLSYEDPAINNAYVFEFDSADKYDYNYLYDGGVIDMVYNSDFGYCGVANVFTAQSDEVLKSVGFDFSKDANVQYEIRIFVNPSREFFRDDTPASTSSGSVTYAGFHTVSLQKPVSLKKGDKFAVAITGRSNGNYLNFNVDGTVEGGFVNSYTNGPQGESYFIEDNDCVYELPSGYTPRVKAYTDTAGIQNPDGFKASLNSDSSVSLSWNPVAGADSYEIYTGTDFGEYKLLASVSDTAYTYTPSQENGVLLKYKVRAVDGEEKGIFSLSRAVRLETTVPLTEISFDAVEIEQYYTAKIPCTFTPSNATDKLLSYSTNDKNVATVNFDGTITAVGTGTATITAWSRDSGLTSQCHVRVTPHVNHQLYTSLEAVDATCAGNGRTAQISCLLCQAVITESEIIPALPHSYTETVTPATCTEGGYTTHVCSVCGHSYTSDETPKTGHKYNETVSDATCTENGERVFTCSVCGDSYTEIITSTGHSFGNWETVTNSTCAVKGERQKTCSVCGVKLTEEIELVPHTYDSVVTEPTCTEGGYTIYTCSVCGDGYKADETEAAGHKYESVVTSATCTENGYTTYTCSVCGDGYKADETEAAGHKYESVVTSATCTEGGYTTHTCSVCGDSYTADETEAAGHKYESAVTPATCTEGGYTTYTCSVCGDSYKADKTKAAGHKYESVVTSATCTEGGRTTKACSVCGDSYITDEVSATGHSYVDTVVLPTCTSGGYTAHVCSTCGYGYNSDEKAATGHNDSDSDGKCNICGQTVPNSVNCSCMCHSSGFMSFIYAIVRIFWMLFRTNKTCACGATHW